jgi:hypothetical protein
MTWWLAFVVESQAYGERADRARRRAATRRALKHAAPAADATGMRRALRENAPCALLAACGCAVLAWLGLYGFAWNDYDNEAGAAVQALVHGHLVAFLQLAPAYGGSLIERAPFALLPGLWGGGSLAVYRMLAVPCLLAAAALAVWLVAGMRAAGSPRAARALALLLCAASPVALPALELGHPEELLGAALCVAAVLLGAGTRPRPLLAGAALGLALANKPWAVLAAGPVLLVVPAGMRLRCAATACALAAAIVAPLALVPGGGFVASARGTASASTTIFQPWQVWWFLGHHGALVHGTFGEAKPGFRTPPTWTGSISHPLVLALGAAITAALWLRRRRLAVAEGLLALALILLARCVLDTWDAVYYTLPFLLALLAWEVRERPLRPPLLTFAATALVWISFRWLPERAAADVQAAAFLAWTLPLAGWLALRLARPAARLPRVARREPQETTVSSLGRLVSTS